MRTLMHSSYRWLAAVLIAPIVFGICLAFCPLDKALLIGADDGFELCKALTLERRPDLAAKMWNDQPWVYTMLTAAEFKLFGEHAAAPRIFNVLSFVGMMVALGYLFKDELSELELALIPAFFLTADLMPTLVSSAMVEIPALSWAVIAAALAWRPSRPAPAWQLALSGLVFAAALQIKLTAVLAFPALAAIVLFSIRRANIEQPTWNRQHRIIGQLKRVGRGWPRLIGWAGGFLVGTVALAWLSPSFDWRLLVKSHLTARADIPPDRRLMYAFHWGSVLENPALVLAAAAGMVKSFRSFRARTRLHLFALALLVMAALFTAYVRPWWNNYIVYLDLPLAIFAVIGAAWTFRLFFVAARTVLRATGPQLGAPTGAGATGPSLDIGSPRIARHAMLTAAILSLWVSFGLPRYVAELTDIFNKRADAHLRICEEMTRYARDSRWCYTRAIVAAFAAKVLIPPELTVIPQKRFWTKQISDERIFQIVKRYEPEELLLGENTELKQKQWLTLLHGAYSFVADDQGVELWVSRKLTGNYSDPSPEARLRAMGAW